MRIRIPNRKKVSKWLVALLIVAVLFGFTFWEREKPLQYDIVVLGDSVMANPGADGLTVTNYLEKQLGMTAFKGAFGGTCMSAQDSNQWGSMSNNEWSMVKLADAICDNDWKSQKATMAYADSYNNLNNQTLDYFVETMNQLSRVDFEKTKILIIEHGTNDYNRGKRVDNPQDAYDQTTFGGALRYSLKRIQESYPDIRIVLLSPIYCVLGENNHCYNSKYGEGGYLYEYVILEQKIAKEFGVEWINAYEQSGIWEENASVYLGDNLHLNEKGHEKLGNFVADYFTQNH